MHTNQVSDTEMDDAIPHIAAARRPGRGGDYHTHHDHAGDRYFETNRPAGSRRDLSQPCVRTMQLGGCVCEAQIGASKGLQFLAHRDTTICHPTRTWKAFDQLLCPASDFLRVVSGRSGNTVKSRHVRLRTRAGDYAL